MSGFMRRVPTLGQNIFDSRQGGPCGAPKVRGGGGGASVMEGNDRNLRCLATSWYQGKGPAIIPWGLGRVTERGILLSKTAYFLCRTVMPCRLSGRKPASQLQASWVSKLCVVRLPVADQFKNPRNFLENCQGGCAEVSMVFINPDIYWDRMFWETLQSRCCSSRPVMENTLR